MFCLQNGSFFDAFTANVLLRFAQASCSYEKTLPILGLAPGVRLALRSCDRRDLCIHSHPLGSRKKRRGASHRATVSPDYHQTGQPFRDFYFCAHYDLSASSGHYVQCLLEIVSRVDPAGSFRESPLICNITFSLNLCVCPA